MKFSLHSKNNLKAFYNFILVISVLSFILSCCNNHEDVYNAWIVNYSESLLERYDGHAPDDDHLKAFYNFSFIISVLSSILSCYNNHEDVYNS